MCALPLKQIEENPLLLSREWTRLLASGGHHRRTKTARPLSKKTVRNIAGILSSAFSKAIRWRLVATNPVTASEPPVPTKRRGMALTTAQLQSLVSAAREPWCLGAFIELSEATGARRGELLALHWADLQDGRFMFDRSLCQTRGGLEFKTTKTRSSD